MGEEAVSLDQWVREGLRVEETFGLGRGRAFPGDSAVVINTWLGDEQIPHD